SANASAALHSSLAAIPFRHSLPSPPALPYSSGTSGLLLAPQLITTKGQGGSNNGQSKHLHARALLGSQSGPASPVADPDIGQGMVRHYQTRSEANRLRPYFHY